MRAHWILILAVALAGAGCGDDDGGADGDASVGIDAPACSPAATLYLNRSGGTYTAGDPNDATTNTSSVVNGSATLAAWAGGDPLWNEVVTCVQGKLAAYGVAVTDVDPGALRHTEIVISGSDSDAVNPGSSGIQWIAPGGCSRIDNTIGFVFAPTPGSVFGVHCDNALQAFASTAGLEMVTNCEDILSSQQCGEKAFRDTDSPCGFNTPATCTCDPDQTPPAPTTQNSHQRMLALYGPPCP
jgi:hypothetical protein